MAQAKTRRQSAQKSTTKPEEPKNRVASEQKLGSAAEALLALRSEEGEQLIAREVLAWVEKQNMAQLLTGAAPGWTSDRRRGTAAANWSPRSAT